MNELKVFSPEKMQGLNKDWVYSSKKQRMLSYEYRRKISWSIEDIRKCCEDVNSRPNIIFIIAATCWIMDATEHFISKSDNKKSILSAVRRDVLDCFEYNKKDIFDRNKQYIKTLRSFVLAHPLDTTDKRHAKYKLDGKYIAVDIAGTCNSIQYKLMSKSKLGRYAFKHLSPDGMINECTESDIFICSCSTDDECKMTWIGFSLNDVVNTINLCTDSLRELDKYLKTIKRQDFIAHRN